MTNQCTEFWMLGSIPRWFQKSLGTETVVPVTGDKNDEKWFQFGSQRLCVKI
jgi:hypothetical protein